ncbi:hypothetical protein [Faecalibacterium sp. An58]|uniref:hypothetical protein n=1 Tax=Faecalibacterium sp. An58 TaxID=1965648 RepID=UPI0011830969|nr:hypothetical protein [Faecalibacterium sp. An58]
MIFYYGPQGYKVSMDLCEDYSNLVRYRLKQQGIKTKARQEFELWYEYFNLRKKMITPRKRHVWYSKEFQCPEENRKGLNILIEKLESGQDVSAYLNKASSNPDAFDMLLYDWGIYHFHLGEKKERNSNYIERTGPVLFARIDQDNAYFIQIYRHGKGVDKQPWSRQEMIKIIHDNWPQTIERYLVPGVRCMTEKISDQMRETLRKNGMFSFVEVSENVVYMPMGGGYASSGHSEEIVLLCNRIHNNLKLAELNIIGNLPTFIHLIEEQTDKKIDHNLHFMLWFVNKEAFVIDLETRVALIKVIL